MVRISAAKLWKTGGGHVITVPAAFIKHGEVDLNKRYDVVLEEASDGKANKVDVGSAEATGPLFSPAEFSFLNAENFTLFPKTFHQAVVNFG